MINIEYICIKLIIYNLSIFKLKIINKLLYFIF